MTPIWQGVMDLFGPALGPLSVGWWQPQDDPLKILKLYVCLCIVCVPLSVLACGGQSTISWSWFSLSACTWVLGIQLRLSRQMLFYLLAVLPACGMTLWSLPITPDPTLCGDPEPGQEASAGIGEPGPAAPDPCQQA